MEADMEKKGAEKTATSRDISVNLLLQRSFTKLQRHTRYNTSPLYTHQKYAQFVQLAIARLVQTLSTTTSVKPFTRFGIR